jgi:hypothetical protein
MENEGEPDLIDYSIEKDQEQDYLPEYNAVANTVQLQDKQLEPSTSISGLNINRNFQLGNIGARTYGDMLDTNARAEIYDNVPMQFGGYLLNRFALKQRALNDFAVVLSGSIEGFNRRVLKTDRKEYVKEQNNGRKTLRERFRVN